mgnify:CR=1 FL=1
MSFFKRFMVMFLIMCMSISAVPMTAFADEIDSTDPAVTEPSEEIADVTEKASEATAASYDTEVVAAKEESYAENYRILHLDCGRKYFSKDWIKALITEMSAAGYNQLQLAFGNDGLRFLLDDMSLVVNGKTYSDAAVTAGIQAGNSAYNATKGYYPDVNELTQTEMDEIIDHAKANGIEIVPHLNMPGHMDAILDAIEYVGIYDAHFEGRSVSLRSLNLENDAAVAFSKALLEKYVAYFDAQGCSYFHIGADEFANDALILTKFP